MDIPELLHRSGISDHFKEKFPNPCGHHWGTCLTDIVVLSAVLASSCFHCKGRWHFLGHIAGSPGLVGWSQFLFLDTDLVPSTGTNPGRSKPYPGKRSTLHSQYVCLESWPSNLCAGHFQLFRERKKRCYLLLSIDNFCCWQRRPSGKKTLIQYM